MRPPFPWYGGKKNVKDIISKHLSKVLDDKTDSKQVYFEPFIGGGTLLFDLQPRHAVVSDINCYLMNLYHVIKIDLESFLKTLDKYELSESKDSRTFFENNVNRFNLLRESVKLDFTNNPTKRQIEIAARFYYMCKRGFGGIINVLPNGLHKVRYAQTKIDGRYLYHFDNLNDVSNYLQHVRLFHGDYKKTLKYAGKGDVVYIDPPYYTESPSQDNYWTIPFDLAEHTRLRDYVQYLDSKGVYVAVSNSNEKTVRNLYKNFKIHNINIRRTVNMSSDKKHLELLITNF